MNILHINTSDHGGAAIACYRLHQGLLSTGVNSKMLVLFKNKSQREVYGYLDHNFNLLQRIFISLKSRFFTYYLLFLKRKLTLSEPISLPTSPYNIMLHPLVQQADIIHLHWVGNFINYPHFFQNCTKPIIWTLHDLNPLLGIYHYRIDARQNHNIYQGLEGQLKNKKKNLLLNAHNITFITLNHWMSKELDKYFYPKRPRRVKIPNGIDLKEFKAHNKTIARKKYSLPLDVKIVLFAAATPKNKRKGLSYLLDIVGEFDSKKVIFCTIGSLDITIPGMINLGEIKSTIDLVYAYSSADIFLIPSVEDNLPNTVLEAMSCNLPVVGFSVGGVPEMVKNNYNGILVDNYDKYGLKNGLIKLLENKSLRLKYGQNSRCLIDEEYSLNESVQAHLKLYKEVQNSRTNSN